MERKKKLLKRIKELEEFVEQQKILIDQLNSEIQQNNFKHIPVIEGDCPYGGWHDYPSPWFSITSPFCKKCGQQAPTIGTRYVVSYDNTDNKTNIT